MKGAAIVRTTLTTLAELLGFAAIAYGCWLIAEPLGLIAAGIALIVVGVRSA